MKNVKNLEELESTIEDLVSGFIEETRRTVREAVERAAHKTASDIKYKQSAKPTCKRTPKKVRNSKDIEKIAEQLCALIRTHPGEHIQVFVEALGLTPKQLYRPMSKLRADGRVRCIGERNQVRYYPGLGTGGG